MASPTLARPQRNPVKILRRVSLCAALLVGCTGSWPPAKDAGLRTWALSLPDSARESLQSSVEVSSGGSQEAGFWVLPPRLERRFARWLCGTPPRRAQQGDGRSMSDGRAGKTGLLWGPPEPPWHVSRPLADGLASQGGLGFAVSPYDDLIQASATRHELDWLLIAALIFHESRFNPCLASSAGAVGLAQILPSTATELGVLDPWEPGQSIEAGTRYLRKMYDVFEPVGEDDRVAFSLASYTAGLGHVLDACSLSAVDGRDPRRWSGNVEETLAQLSDTVFAQRATHGGAHGHQAVAFVNLVLERWRDYAATRDSLWTD